MRWLLRGACRVTSLTGALVAAWCVPGEAPAPDASPREAAGGKPPERQCMHVMHEGDKPHACRVWPALVSALHYNLHGHLYAPLFTNFMGFGDKETFAFAMIVHGLPVHTFPQPPSSVGLLRRRCDVFGCWDAVNTNTMLQLGAGGAPLFMHTNMPPKLNLAVPVDFDRYIRRWQVVSPGVEDVVEGFMHMSQREFGCAPPPHPPAPLAYPPPLSLPTTAHTTAHTGVQGWRPLRTHGQAQ